MTDDPRPRPRSGGSIIPRVDETEVLRKVAHGIAHGMNNVLASVMGLASVLETELEPGSTAAEDVHAILKASRQGLDLMRSLLNLAQDGEAEKTPLSMNQVVEAVASFLRPSLPETIQMETHLAPDLALVAGESGQLRHAIMSLAVNAQDAVLTSGILTFTTKNVVLDAQQLADTSCEPGHYVRLQVGDTGSGMDELALERAFDPFFSTKSTDDVAGLGLPLVYGIVRKHGGRVVLYSKQGLGTTVTIDLPALDPLHQSSNPPGWPGQVKKRGETVLVVDDDPLVLRSSSRLLEKLGYDVVCASDGDEAVKLYVEKADQITLVLLDLVMPGIDGGAVLKRLLRTDPEARVVICSGYGNNESIQGLLDAGALAAIEKPFTYKQLSKILAGFG